MMEKKEIDRYERFLEEKELSRNTVLLYTARAKNFLQTCESQEIDKSAVNQYVERMREIYKPRTVNIYIISLNRYLRWAGYQEC